MTNFYLVLGLSPSAAAAEVKAQYHRMARERHPDKGGDSAAFAELRQAYDVLSNPAKRAQYDAERAAWMTKARAVQCPGCGEANRVRALPRGKLPVCGGCGAELPTPAGSVLAGRAREIAVAVGAQVTEQAGELLLEGVDWGVSKLRQKLGLPHRPARGR